MHQEYGNDAITESGAKRLQAKIEEYWRSRGYDVNVRLERGPYVISLRGARTDIRSDMKNGKPVRRAA